MEIRARRAVMVLPEDGLNNRQVNKVNERYEQLTIASEYVG